jgi:3-methyl-2-oxobutanoate hydroxymethyltransferase
MRAVVVPGPRSCLASSGATKGDPMSRPVTVPAVRSAKGDRPLVMITAYDAPTARWADEGGADLVLVGDSLAMVVLGHENTLSVTMDEMIHHARAVTRTTSRPLVVGDLPFGAYQTGVEDTVRAGIRYLKEARVQAVKLEGRWPDRVEALSRAGIPVMGHLGLTPQSVHAFGGYKVQGRTFERARELVAAAQELELAGCFAIVLEGIPAQVASVVTNTISIPTIGIGAGPDCDGQVLVVHDLVGMSPPPLPRFVETYAHLGDRAVEAVGRWAEDVRQGAYPAPQHTYQLNPETAALWAEEYSEA